MLANAIRSIAGTIIARFMTVILISCYQAALRQTRSGRRVVAHAHRLVNRERKTSSVMALLASVWRARRLKRGQDYLSYRPSGGLQAGTNVKLTILLL